ncbi:MAG: hypothetical protein AAFX81_18590, partial [Pseudomonadota bacterium]
MRLALSVAVVLFVGLLAAVVASPRLIPEAWLRSSVVEPLTAALDRSVEIDGPVRVQFLPQPGLALEDVRI